jgi:hypothetical protein
LPRAVSLHRPHLFTHSTRFICSANFAMNPLSTSHGAIFSLLAGFISSAVRLMLADRWQLSEMPGEGADVAKCEMQATRAVHAAHTSSDDRLAQRLHAPVQLDVSNV